MPTRDDVLDALVLMSDYRAAVDRDEQQLIAGARALGIEWEEIGEALGYPTRSAKQAASARAGRLAKRRPLRFPRRRPLVDDSPTTDQKGDQ